MPTIYDVATLAGVSASTVSRAFRNPERISEAARERVLAAARDLGYEPRMSDGSASPQPTLLIALVLADIQNPFSATLAKGVQDAVSREGHVLVICSSSGDAEEEIRVLREVNRRGVDGFIVTPPQREVSSRTNDYIRQMLIQGVPMVFVGNRLNDPNVLSVTCLAQDGAVQAVHYLASLGHKEIGFIGGRYSQGVAVGRWLGYQEALIANRLPIRPEYMLEGELSRASGEALMYHLLNLAEPPTAVLTVNDLMAIGAMDACYKRGIDVPGQVSIIGFDNIDMAELTRPRLTTVAQPSYLMGRKAADLLLQRCREPNLPPQQVLLPSSLILRESTAAPGAAWSPLAPVPHAKSEND